MKKTTGTSITLLLLSLPLLLAQSWQALDYRTPAGYAALLEQYEDDHLLPIEERFSFYKTGVQAARHQEDSSWLAQFAYRVASTANALDSLDTALEYIAIARSAVDEADEFVVDVINYQGVLHKQSGDYEQALAYYEEALQISQDKSPQKRIMPLSNIATLYRGQKNYEKTLAYLRQLDEIASELDSLPRVYHRVYNNAEFCIIHKSLNNLDSAAYYAGLCLENLDKLDKGLNMKATGFAYITVAEFYIEKLQQPERAKPLLDSAFLYVEGAYETKVKVSLGKYYLATGELAKAGAVVRELEQSDIGSQTTRLRALELAEQYYTTTGNYEAALAAVKIIQETDAEIFSEQKNRLTSFYAAKFQNDRQREALRELRNQQRVTTLKHRSQRSIFLLLSALALAVVAFLWFQNRRRKAFAQVLQKEVNLKTQDLQMVNTMLAEKIDKLDAFTYTVSHDLTTPLRAAANFATLIREQSEKGAAEASQETLSHLESVLAHLRDMVDGVARFMQADKLELAPSRFCPRELITEVITQLKHYDPDHLRAYRLTVDSNTPECYADPLLFRQLIHNLLSNAIKATRHTEQPRISVRITPNADGQGVLLTIADNGVGIPVHGKKRLFQLFKSVHSRDQFPGTGVGLAIVKRIVERHGGTIEVESAGEGKGAKFTLLFPEYFTVTTDFS